MTALLEFGYLKTIVIVALAASTAAELSQTDPLSKEEHYRGDEHNVKYDQEAFLGKDQAAEYRELTPQQSKERLRKLITSVIDKDGDNLVTEQELKDHIIVMQKISSQKETERNWENFRNRIVKDKLKWEDYKEMVYGTHEHKSEEMIKEYAESAERDRKRWKYADTSADDHLNKEEYACFMHPENCKHMDDVIVLETTEYIDKNKDGLIDLDEYIGQWYKREEYVNNVEPEWVTRERRNFKDNRDEDKDGKLNFQEMKEWILPSNYERIDIEVQHLMNVADDNRDGVLSTEEFLNHHQHFVGSQATNYGEQLRKHDPTEL